MYDVEQRCWVDIPTFARIEVRPKDFLLFRAKSTLNIDSADLGTMDSLILQLQSQYKQHIPEITWNIPEARAAQPVTPVRNKASGSVRRQFKRKRSEEHTPAATSSSPGCITRSSAKRMRAEEQVV